MPNDNDAQKIIDRFTTETVKVSKPPVRDKARPLPERETVDADVTVIMANDFNNLVQSVFQFPEGERRYDVRLDLWSALQHKLDHPFHIPETGFLPTKAAIEDFKKRGGHIGKARYILDHFVREELLPPGRYIIRFLPEARQTT